MKVFTSAWFFTSQTWIFLEPSNKRIYEGLNLDSSNIFLLCEQYVSIINLGQELPRITYFLSKTEEYIKLKKNNTIPVMIYLSLSVIARELTASLPVLNLR